MTKRPNVLRVLFACLICSVLLSAAADGYTRKFSGSGIATFPDEGRSYMMRFVSGTDVTAWMDGTCAVLRDTPGSAVAMCFGTKNVGHGYVLTVNEAQELVTVTNDNFSCFEIDFSVSENPDVVFCRLPIWGMCELMGVFILDSSAPCQEAPGFPAMNEWGVLAAVLSITGVSSVLLLRRRRSAASRS